MMVVLLSVMWFVSRCVALMIYVLLCEHYICFLVQVITCIRGLCDVHGAICADWIVSVGFVIAIVVVFCR